MQSLVVYFTHLSLVLSVRYRLITASRTLQAQGEMCTLQTGKLCYHAINISGRSRGADRDSPPPSLSFDQNEARRAGKFFWGDRSPPPPPTLSQGLDPPLNINYVLVLVYMQNCMRAQSLVCHGPS